MRHLPKIFLWCFENVGPAMPRSWTTVWRHAIAGHLKGWSRRAACRRADVHHGISVLLALSCSRFDDIHQLATSSLQADMRICSWPTRDGKLKPNTWLSSAYRWPERPHRTRPTWLVFCITLETTLKCNSQLSGEFLADRTNGRAIATLLRLSSVVCLWRYVLWLNGAS